MNISLRRAVRLATIFLIVAGVTLTASIVSCSRQTSDLQPGAGPVQTSGALGFQIPDAGNLILMLGSDGQLEPVAGTAKGQSPDQDPELDPALQQVPGPIPFAIQTAIAAVQGPIDGGVIIAVNRSGLVYLGIQDQQVLLRRIDGADSEFSGRSVAQAWTWDGKALFLLHRNEIFETEAARTPVARVLAVKAEGAVVLRDFRPATGKVDQEDSDLYGAPYAVFPRTSDTWLLQFRLAGRERTSTAFASWNPDLQRLEQLDRSSYETAVRPAPMADAPVALRQAAEALGGSLIMDATMPDGSQKAWVQGNADSSIAVRAMVLDNGVTSLASDGRLAIVNAKEIYENTIAPPVPNAYFRDLALLEGYIIAVWEEDLFPDLGRSGLVILNMSLLVDGASPPPGQPSLP